MAEIVRMPKLSDTMTEGVVAEWHKKVGDQVESGEVLAEIETDKATMEFESFQDGVLLHIGVDKGATAAVDSILAILGRGRRRCGGPARGRVPQAPAEAAAPAPTPAPAPAPVAPAPAPAARSRSGGGGARCRSSGTHCLLPMGRSRLRPWPPAWLQSAALTLGRVTGSGEGGPHCQARHRGLRPCSCRRPRSRGVFHRHSGVANAQDHCAPIWLSPSSRRPTSTSSCPLKWMRPLSRPARPSTPRTGVKVSFNDMVVKAVSLALKKHPAVNSAWMDTHIRTNDHVHIGVAVAVEDGLLVPVVRHADRKVPHRNWRRGQGFTQGRPATRSSSPAIGKATPSPSPTSACSALRTSQPSSTRQMLASWQWAVLPMFLWSGMVPWSQVR